MNCREETVNILTSSKPISNKHSTAPLTGKSLVEKVVFPIRIDLYFSSLGFLIKKKSLIIYNNLHFSPCFCILFHILYWLYAYEVVEIPALKKEDAQSRKTDFVIFTSYTLPATLLFNFTADIRETHATFYFCAVKTRDLYECLGC